MSDSSPVKGGSRRGLAMLDGSQGPDWLAGDLAMVCELPKPAFDDLWRIVLPVLDDPMLPAAEKTISDFCREYQIEASTLARSLKAIRFLFRLAAQTASPKAKLLEDVHELLEQRPKSAPAIVSPNAVEALFARYFVPATSKIEGDIQRRTLFGLGKVLVDFDWQVSTITASSFGKSLRIPVVTLTLRYEENGKREAISLHASSSVLGLLRDTLASLVK